MCCKLLCFGIYTCSTESSTVLWRCSLQPPTSPSRFYSDLHTCFSCTKRTSCGHAASAVSSADNAKRALSGNRRGPSSQTSAAAQTPEWLIVPERGLFTGIAIFGAVGSGKTSGCIYPFAEQCSPIVLKTLDAGLPDGDFCHKVRRILKKHGRPEDYVEVSLASPCRYNPLHNGGLCPRIRDRFMLNSLFGRSKEPVAFTSNGITPTAPKRTLLAWQCAVTSVERRRS